MIKEYKIEGMTCGSCVAKVKKYLENADGVIKANIQLTAPQGIIKLDHPIDVEALQSKLGKYKIEEIQEQLALREIADLPEKPLATYQPLLLIIAFIAGISILVQYPFHDFSGMLWMRHFMAGFFLVFAFFKLLNIRGFANSYQMYDIIAGRWKGWGYIYPFVELGLGILYLINVAPALTNIVTVVVLGTASIGVIKSNLDQRKIKCACLGDVFNLPMSTVTIVEDLSMTTMAVVMLWLSN